MQALTQEGKEVPSQGARQAGQRMSSIGMQETRVWEGMPLLGMPHDRWYEYQKSPLHDWPLHDGRLFS